MTIIRPPLSVNNFIVKLYRIRLMLISKLGCVITIVVFELRTTIDYRNHGQSNDRASNTSSSNFHWTLGLKTKIHSDRNLERIYGCINDKTGWSLS